MEEFNKAIKASKSDWKNMQKTLLKEATVPEETKDEVTSAAYPEVTAGLPTMGKAGQKDKGSSSSHYNRQDSSDIVSPFAYTSWAKAPTVPKEDWLLARDNIDPKKRKSGGFETRQNKVADVIHNINATDLSPESSNYLKLKALIKNSSNTFKNTYSTGMDSAFLIMSKAFESKIKSKMSKKDTIDFMVKSLQDVKSDVLPRIDAKMNAMYTAINNCNSYINTVYGSQSKGATAAASQTELPLTKNIDDFEMLLNLMGDRIHDNSMDLDPSKPKAHLVAYLIQAILKDPQNPLSYFNELRETIGVQLATQAKNQKKLRTGGDSSPFLVGLRGIIKTNPEVIKRITNLFYAVVVAIQEVRAIQGVVDTFAAIDTGIKELDLTIKKNTVVHTKHDKQDYKMPIVIANFFKNAKNLVFGPTEASVKLVQGELEEISNIASQIQEVDTSEPLPPDQTNIPGTNPMTQQDENMIQTTKTGPGKIFDPNNTSSLYEERSAEDHVNKKKTKLNEAWKKYSSVKRTNNEKPDEFTFIIG